jgi:hypothetical protein
VKIKIRKSVILPVVLHECGAWSLTLKEEHRLKAFEKRVLFIIFGLKSEKVTREWRRLHNAELDDLHSSSIMRVLKQEECDGRDM